MIEVLIIEDEQLAADKLEMLLNRSSFDIKVIYICGSIVEAVASLKQHTPDLIFCDIHLADGIAFSIFEQIEVKTPIIFTTAYDQYALKAFEQYSIDYLLKPIDEKGLLKSLAKFKDLQRENEHIVDMRDLAKLMEKGRTYKKRFLVSIGSKFETIEVEDIAYFFSTDKQTYIMVMEGRKYPIDDSLNGLRGNLDPTLFFHINRNFIIHINSIENMYRASARKTMLEIKPKPPLEVKIPEEKLTQFKEWLDA